jgi:cytochrome c oxidase subunit 2
MMQKLLGLPLNASADGAPIDALIVWMHWLMLVLFVGWGLFFAYILFRFSKSRNPRADHDGVKSHFSSYIEILVAVIEIVLLVSLSIPFWAKKVSAFPTDPNTLHVRIIAQQFAWNVQYPGPDGKFGRHDIKMVKDDNPIGLDRKDKAGKDDVVELNQLRLPVNRPVILEITTKDVIHSFSIPLMRVKQDTIPGMRIPMYFTPTMTSDEIREQQVTTIHLPTTKNWKLYCAMDDYKDKDGKFICRKHGLNPATGDRFPLSPEQITKLIENGVTEIRIGPFNPVEIACAQLCGLNHYGMKGAVQVLSEKDFTDWYKAAVEDASQ